VALSVSSFLSYVGRGREKSDSQVLEGNKQKYGRQVEQNFWKTLESRTAESEFSLSRHLIILIAEGKPLNGERWGRNFPNDVMTD
jgi:hypothetical protein